MITRPPGSPETPSGINGGISPAPSLILHATSTLPPCYVRRLSLNSSQKPGGAQPGHFSSFIDKVRCVPAEVNLSNGLDAIPRSNYSSMKKKWITSLRLKLECVL